ncbi:MAG: hypothetical protein ACYC6N_26675, partial [Pirellulaceae bacterium]
MSLLFRRANPGQHADSHNFRERVPGGDDFNEIKWQMGGQDQDLAARAPLGEMSLTQSCSALHVLGRFLWQTRWHHAAAGRPFWELRIRR